MVGQAQQANLLQVVLFLKERKTVKELVLVDQTQGRNENMGNKSLINLLDEFYKNSSKLSDLIRNIAFVGIGIIWILSNEIITNISDYLFSLAAFTFGLLLDMFQYLWKTITLHCLFKAKEKEYDNKKIKDEEEILKPYYIERGSWVFFILKIVSILLGFILLFIYIFSIC
jgi:hypothetical protein